MSDQDQPSTAQQATTDDSDSEMEVEMELIYEDEQLRDDYLKAREWLDKLQPTDLLRSDLFTEEGIATLKTEFIHNAPFPHLVLEGFIDRDFLEKVSEEAKNLEYQPKNNDLYLFHQSVLDLKNAKSPLIQKVCQVLYSDEFLHSLRSITGLELYGLDNASQPDLFSAVYQDTCRLLCHDDNIHNQQHGRKIAYILYLTEDWDAADGGHLDLFDSIEMTTRVPGNDSITTTTLIPNAIQKALVPKFAQFAMFEVNDRSFHQVREVLSEINPRFSLSGWFHGPLENNSCLPKSTVEYTSYTPSLPHTYPPQALSTLPTRHETHNLAGLSKDDIDDITLHEVDPHQSDCGVLLTKEEISEELEYWINPVYLDPSTAKQSRGHFGTESSIELRDILRNDRYNELWAACMATEITTFGEPRDAVCTQQQQQQQGVQEATPQDTQDDTTTNADNDAILKCKKTHINTNTIPVNYRPDASSGWEFIGPIHQQCYYRAIPAIMYKNDASNDDVAPNTQQIQHNHALIQRFHQFINSHAFFILIKRLTDCDISTLYSEYRLYRPGCYRLSHDADLEMTKEGMDITFTLLPPDPAVNVAYTKAVQRELQRQRRAERAIKRADGIDVDSDTEDENENDDANHNNYDDYQKRWIDGDLGGSTHYLRAGEDEELLTIYPQSNTLSIVYREAPPEDTSHGILQFTRYINHHAPSGMHQFHILARLDDDEAYPDPSRENVTAKKKAKTKATNGKKKTTKGKKKK